ncbi:hypothetical protein ACH5RR_018274 [Cinchona calisaya]|uniref:RNase H type-1 domain-containing protein n=1 Tax=Cinchona calisaya TaxID=153742 RepID=A0ABD2ZPL4_9GENT
MNLMRRKSVQLSEGSDKIVWEVTSKGGFSVTSTILVTKWSSKHISSKTFFWDKRMPMKLLGKEFLLCRFTGNFDSKEEASSISQVRWHPSTAGFFKIYCDGASKANPSLAASGGIIKNNKGSPIAAFSNHYGTCTNMQAEALAILDGVKLCTRFNISSFQIELDSKTLVDVMNNITTAPWKVDGIKD